jgi:DNA-binding GntR family transcriptional regulator
MRSASGARAESRDAIGATTAMRVAADLRQRILTGEFAPGSRLKIDDIAAICAVSHMPVRGALHMLEREGVLDVLPHRGAVIRPVDARFVRNVYDLRAAIEGMLTERCAESVDTAGIAELRGLLAAFEQACAAADPLAVVSANREFHDSINRTPTIRTPFACSAQGRLLIEAQACASAWPETNRRDSRRASPDHARHRGGMTSIRKSRVAPRAACAPATICSPASGAHQCASVCLRAPIGYARRMPIVSLQGAELAFGSPARSTGPNSRSMPENVSRSSATPVPASRRCSTSSRISPISTAASSCAAMGSPWRWSSRSRSFRGIEPARKAWCCAATSSSITTILTTSASIGACRRDWSNSCTVSASTTPPTR